MGTSAPAREEMLARLHIVRELGARSPGTYLGRRDGEPSPSHADVVLETYANLDPREMERVSASARRLVGAPPHPHLVSVIAADRIGSGLSVVTDFIDGIPIDDVFFRMSMGARLRAVVDVLAALSALHAMNGSPIVHGGVLRLTSFVEKTGRTKLGFAYRQATCLGKDTHAPEALLGDEAAIGPRTDVYGAGVFLWEAVMGRALFGDDQPDRVVQKQLAGRVDKASLASRDKWARPLLPVIERALAIDPASRYQSIAEMAAALRIAVRARLMMHEDVIEDLWPAETKPKHQSGTQPAAKPLVAEATEPPPSETLELEDAPELEVALAPPISQPQTLAIATPAAPLAVQATALPVSMDATTPAEGTTSGIVSIAYPPLPLRAPQPSRGRGRIIVACACAVALLTAAASLLVYVRASRPVAAHADAMPEEHAAPAIDVPSAHTAVEREDSNPTLAPAASGDHAPTPSATGTATPTPRKTKHGPKARTAYDPSSI